MPVSYSLFQTRRFFRFSGIILVGAFLASLWLVSCAGPKAAKSPSVITQEIMLDPVEVVAYRNTPETEPELPVYRPSETREIDILHTKLDLRFDWEEQAVIGNAEIMLRPVFYPVSAIQLDALHFDIHSVTHLSSGQPMGYSYNDSTLVINLERVLTKKDPPLRIGIAYTAHPGMGASEGRGAISSDEGLFFIDPLDEDEQVPTQIWTQGETENNRRWFPTFDHPNEKMTHEISLTVRDSFETLSNGILRSSVSNGDGTRTDTWVMDQPHAPYLVMIAVGDFAVVEDTWNGIPLMYYVDPLYEPSAKLIFNHTPEMLDFFSEKLGVPYPWKKYAQIVVHEYVSGAMENTTAVVFGDFVQDHADHFLTESENDYIVAHEMIHHWFGDLVTCESWANLTLNEGFANYGEYLWFEHKYGKDEADYARRNELKGYFGQAAYDMHPLIHFSYADKERMFDAHSYNKGGLVLHMLRKYMGDEAFFEGVRRYLTKHAYKAVEIHDLRLAFEEVTGEDLNWFFNQWYLSAGHPVLEYTVSWSPDDQVCTLEISQEQDAEKAPAIFRLPISVDLIYPDGTSEEKEIWMNRRKQAYAFRLDREPAHVLLDADDVLVAVVRNTLDNEKAAVQLQAARSVRHRLEALKQLTVFDGFDAGIFSLAARDSHWSVRSMGVEALDETMNQPEITGQVLDLAQNDPDVRVRLSALDQLDLLGHPETPVIAEKWLFESHKTDVVFTCLQILVKSDREKARQIIDRLDLPLNEALQIGKALIYSAEAKPGDASFFIEKLPDIRQYLESYLEQYFTFFGKQDAPLVRMGIQTVVDYIGGHAPPYQKYVAMRELVGFLQALKEGQVKSTFNRQERETIVAQTRDELSSNLTAGQDDLWNSYMQNLLRDLDQE